MPNPNDGLIAGESQVQALTTAITPAAGYLGQSVSQDVLSPTAVVLTTAYGYLTRVMVPAGGLSAFLDVAFTSAGAVTNAVWALFTGSGSAPVAYTAESHAAVTGAAGFYSIPWVTPAQLAPGTYYVYQCVTGTAPSMPGVTATATGSVGAAILNPNCNLTGSPAGLNSAVMASGAPTVINGATTLAWGTGWALAASKLWCGLR